MRTLNNIAKLFLLLLTGVSIGVLWFYCRGFLPHEFHGARAISPEAERFGGMVTIGVLLIAPALPVYRLFPERTTIAAGAVGWIPLALSLALAHSTNISEDAALSSGLAAAEGVMCWVAVILGAMIAKSILRPKA
jgi:hypothetical protein